MKMRGKITFFKKMTEKQQFLQEHNKLSPSNLQATDALLMRFKTEKPTLFKNKNWPFDKLRRPFIFWLTSLTAAEKENIEKNK